jgi:ABC-2 type transport system ATP-binding protein
MLSLDGISKRFGRKWAVRDLTLEVPGGEVFGLLGPNGAGKTTAIRMIAGLLQPTEGSITIGGLNVLKDPLKAKSNMGYIPDRAFFYEKLTVREFMLFVASIFEVPKEVARSRMEKLSIRFGIKDIEGNLIEGCSHGMRQRLLFASALLHEPGLLLIDEPFVGLDPFGVSLVKDVLKELAASGVAVFLATHSLHIASEVCHRVGLIKNGSLVSLVGSGDIRDHQGGLEGLFMKELGP